MAALTSELDTATDHHQELADEIESLKQRLKQKSESLHDELDQREARSLELSGQLNTVQGKAEELRALLDQETNKYSKAMEAHKQRIQELRQRDAQLALLEQTMQQQEAQGEQLRTEKESAERALGSSKAALQQFFQDFKALMETFEREMDEMNNRTVLLERKIRNTQQALTQHISLVRFWQSSTQEKQLTIISLRNQVHGAVIRHNQQDSEKQRIFQQLQEKDKELHNVLQQSEELQKQAALLQEVHNAF